MPGAFGSFWAAQDEGFDPVSGLLEPFEVPPVSPFSLLKGLPSLTGGPGGSAFASANVSTTTILNSPFNFGPSQPERIVSSVVPIVALAVVAWLVLRRSG